VKHFTRPISTITQVATVQAKLGLYRSTQLDQAHNNMLSSQRALSKAQTLKRVKQYVP